MIVKNRHQPTACAPASTAPIRVGAFANPVSRAEQRFGQDCGETLMGQRG